MFSTLVCMQSGRDSFDLFSCPNEHARSFLHMNNLFILFWIAPFLSIIKFSLQVVFNDINVVIVCLYSCIIRI